MKYFSTFSGIGGIELGIGDKGECVGYSEIDKYACQIYDKHFKHKNYGNIRNISTDTLPDFDMLCGGFPCQSFSITGKRRGFDDTRGTLFFELARIAKAKRPRYLFFENVKGLLSHDGGKTFDTIIRTIDELGYDCQWQVLNSKNFGVPQNRERVFIIGHLRGTSRSQIFPLRQDSQPDIVLPTLTTRYYGGQANGGYIGSKPKQIEQLNNPPHSNSRLYGVRGLAPSLNTMQGGNRQPKIYAFKTNTKQGYDIAQEGDGINLAFPESKTRRGRVIKNNSPTLQLNNQVGTIQGMKIRRLTPKECERLQGFPETEKSVIIEVCKNANGVELSLTLKNEDNAVQADVLIDCVENGVEIRSPKKLFLNAKNAEKKNWSHPHIKIDDFVQMLVGMPIIVEKIVNNGKVVLLPNVECLIPLKNGEKLGSWFGSEIMQPVGDAKNDLIILNELLKSTTLNLLGIGNLEQKLATLSLFVIRAINGFIPKEILNPNSFTIEVKTNVGYTYGVSDSQRYKCLGNAVTVNVIKAIVTKLLINLTD